MGSNSKLLFSKKDAALLLSLSIRSLEYLIASKELTVRRVGKRILIPRQTLEQFVRSDHAVCRPGKPVLGNRVTQ
jgi:excisionase family DNA binding protein